MDGRGEDICETMKNRKSQRNSGLLVVLKIELTIQTMESTTLKTWDSNFTNEYLKGSYYYGKMEERVMRWIGENWCQEVDTGHHQWD